MIDTKQIVFRTMELLGTTMQIDVAKYFGVNNKQITDWKKGNSNPPYRKLIELANDRKVNLNWYFNGKGTKYITRRKQEPKTDDSIVNNQQNGDNNHISININSNVSEIERKELQEIAELLDYTPKIYVTQFIEKMRDFKKQCEEAK